MLDTARVWPKRAIVAALSAVVCLSEPGLARELADFSLEELLNESVTSVSKREQRRADVGAAIAVLSNEDLRRSGVTGIPDALRLVPGMNVAAVNANQWAVSARGFNHLYANKLLVLVDGRAVYTPLFAGVFWDLQQPLMEDVDRIEVIRGPGATVWGANAVNGVVNVVTSSARETQGTMVVAGGGEGLEFLGAVRHGGKLGENTYYRVFGRHESNESYRLVDGRPAGDEWNRFTSGFRVDSYPEVSTHLTWQADLAEARLEGGGSRARNVNTLGRWSRDLGANGSVEAQMYFDQGFRVESARGGARMNTADLEFQHTLSGGAGNQILIWGAGYRRVDSKVWETSPLLPVLTPRFRLNLFSAFVQDEIEILPERLTLTGGFKVEHNDFTGFEVQPSVRGVFKPTARQTIWAAVSRAVRTPSALEDKDVFGAVPGPPAPWLDGNLYEMSIRGNGNPDSEIVWAYEAGWRLQPARTVSVDLALFYNRYSDLIGMGMAPRLTPGVPFGRAEFSYENSAGATTYGGELTVAVAPVETWRVELSHSILEAKVPGLPAGFNFDPESQTTLRFSNRWTRGTELDVQVRRVEGFDVLGYLPGETVPAYTALDVRLGHRFSEGWEGSLVGQNLLESQHAEQGTTAFAIVSHVPRRVFVRLKWRF